MRVESMLWLLALTQPVLSDPVAQVDDPLLVEVVVFARNEPDAEAGAGQKPWSTFAGQELAPYTGDPNRPVRVQPLMQRLPADVARLEAAIRRLRGADGYTLLHHHAYLQPLIGSTVRLRPDIGEEHLSARGAHAAVVEFDGSVSVAGDKAFVVRVRAAVREPMDGRMAEFQIDQSNRIASGETAYFDHRRFGVLVRVERLVSEVADGTVDPGR